MWGRTSSRSGVLGRRRARQEAESDLLGGEGDDDIDGNAGADVAHLDAGDDSFTWDPGDGSDLVEGQDGTDTMIFNARPGTRSSSSSRTVSG